MAYKEILKLSITPCYKSDNYLAYEYDKNKLNNLIQTNDDISDGVMSFLKYTNFVPCYDKWCLYCCDKNANKKCSNCKSVYLCSKKCQKSAWSIHKKHCNRDLFKVCINCGIDVDEYIKCDNCPVKFCSESCKNMIYEAHLDYDCKYFTKTFNK